MQTKFIADDGQEFDTPEECEAHEVGLKQIDTIKAKLEEAGHSEKKAKEYAKVLVWWETEKAKDAQVQV